MACMPSRREMQIGPGAVGGPMLSRGATRFGWKSLVGNRIEAQLIPSSSGAIIRDAEGVSLVAQDIHRRMAKL